MTDTPRDVSPHPGGETPPHLALGRREPAHGHKTGTSMTIDARHVVALDLLVDLYAVGPSKSSRSKLVQEAIKEYLERRGYRAEWHADRNAWTVAIIDEQTGQSRKARWLGATELPTNRRTDLP